MSIRLYNYIASAPEPQGYRENIALTGYFGAFQVMGFSSLQAPELKNISLSGGFCVQVAVKMMSINNGTIVANGVNIQLGNRSQIFSVPTVTQYVPFNGSGNSQWTESNYRDAFGIYVDSSGALHVQLNATTGQLDFASANGVITTGQWYRICANLTSSGALTVSVNGTQVISQSVTIGNLNTIAYLAPVLGYSSEPTPSSGGLGAYHLDAEIDSAWVWLGGLTSSDIKSLANGHSPYRVSAFPILGFTFGPGSVIADPSGSDFDLFPNQPLTQSVFGSGGLPIQPVNMIYSGATVWGQSSPPFGATHRGRQRFQFPLIRRASIGMDSGRFTDLATVHAIRHISVSASSSAVFTGIASEIAKNLKSLTDSATFTASADGGVHAIKQLPSVIGTFRDLASASVIRNHISPVVDSAVFHDVASVVDIGTKARSATVGARFFDQASASGTKSVSAEDTATFSENLARNGHFVHALDTVTFHESASARNTLRASGSAKFSDVAFGGLPKLPFVLDQATFSDVASAHKPTVFTQHVQDSFRFLFTLATVRDSSVFAGATDTAAFSDEADAGGSFAFAVAASDQAFVLTETVQATFRRAYAELPPGAKGRFSDRASAKVARLRKVSASDSFYFTSSVSVDAANMVRSSVADTARFTDLATESRIGAINPSDSAKFTGAATSHAIHIKTASDSAAFSESLSEVLVKRGASDRLKISDIADASVSLAGGSVVPGGDQAVGLRQVLWHSLSTEFPASYAESAEGLLMIATGVDPVVAWDGTSGAAWQAGLSAPSSVVWMEGAGVGSIMGRRWAYLRWVDTHGNTSNLSQVSDPIDLGGDGFVESVTYSSSLVTVRSTNHGLSTGDQVIISGVNGLPIINGQWTLTVADANTFTLDGLVIGGGTYTGGGVWTHGVSGISYTNVTVPNDPKVARRQILRNLAGDASVFYVDVDTTDLTSTSLSSTKTDEQLATGTAVPIQFMGDESTQRGVPAANRFGPPPSWKCALAAYSGRVWATADRAYGIGNVSVSYGSAFVLGLGTRWTEALTGRLLYVPGSQPQSIDSVDVDNQILTLETAYQGPSQVFAFYQIRPAPVERLLVYYSEPHLPEAWPPWNAFSVPETSDEIVGLMNLKSFLYIIKERNIYKFAFKEDPGRDGYVFPTANRGCVNNRSYVIVESLCYMLDEAGIFSFDGDSTDPVSEQVQVLFKPDPDTPYQVDWTADRTLWHAVHDPSRETIRWFVDLVGQPSLTTAICFDYRRRSWWLERYPEAVSSSALAVVSGYRQPAVGTTGRRVYCLGQGTLDGIAEDSTGSLRGTVTEADSISLTDTSAAFPANLAGVPVTLVTGTGAGQQAIISSNTSTTLAILKPWKIVPDTTTVYQLGGVSWSWKSSWRRFAEDEAENPRDLEFVFKPTRTASTFGASLYYDHSSTPSEWGYDIDRDGISISNGDDAMVIDMMTPRGYAIQRLSGHRDPYGYGHRYLALELNGVQGVDPQRVYQLVINGVE